MSTTKCREVKSSEFISTLAFFLQNGFALTGTSRMLRDEQPDGAVLAPFVDVLRPGATDNTRPAEVQCQTLLKRKAACCFQFWSDKESDNLGDIMKNVPCCALWFFGRHGSGMPIIDYLHYVIPPLHCSEEALIMAVVYIARAVQKGVPFTQRSEHRMLAAALIVAIKMHDERPYGMCHYARIMGIQHEELLDAEAAMLGLLEFATFVAPAEYILMLFSLRSCHVQLDPTEFGTWNDVSRDLGVPGVLFKTTAQEPVLLVVAMCFVKSVKDLKNLRALHHSTRSFSASSSDSEFNRTARTGLLSGSARSPDSTLVSGNCWPSLLKESSL